MENFTVNAILKSCCQSSLTKRQEVWPLSSLVGEGKFDSWATPPRRGGVEGIRLNSTKVPPKNQ